MQHTCQQAKRPWCMYRARSCCELILTQVGKGCSASSPNAETQCILALSPWPCSRVCGPAPQQIAERLSAQPRSSGPRRSLACIAQRATLQVHRSPHRRESTTSSKLLHMCRQWPALTSQGHTTAAWRSARQSLSGLIHPQLGCPGPEQTRTPSCFATSRQQTGRRTVLPCGIILLTCVGP